MALLPMVFGLIFQSTLPYGSDIRYRAANSCKRISIHAPLRERNGYSATPSIDTHFNPRSLTGATRCIVIICSYFLFQSTLPYGSESDICALTEPGKFQSTLPYGSDQPYKSCPPDGNISIHAPLRERREPERTE